MRMSLPEISEAEEITIARRMIERLSRATWWGGVDLDAREKEIALLAIRRMVADYDEKNPPKNWGTRG